MLILLSRYFIIQKELDNSFYIIIPFVHYMPYNVSQNEIDITMCLRYVLKIIYNIQAITNQLKYLTGILKLTTRQNQSDFAVNYVIWSLTSTK